ncbi:TIGR00282 family metallophosphoesterase [candidate division KSB1 bacterium]|nr:TIGR00282 family metallophosphoesterase [candidate division KSB1 bacterium]
MRNNNIITVLFVADIVGKPGLRITRKYIPEIKAEHQVDFCIANGENGAGGKGITEKLAREYFELGIDAITSGNHIFEKANVFKQLADERRLLRPLNYPPTNPGHGTYIATLQDNVRIAVMNIQGRTFMYSIDCPFRTISEELNKINEVTKIIIVDFHAEATAEKMAMGWYLDGKVSAVIGTHTHIQTADERILTKGTGYITDAGMTGPYDSVIGLKKEIAIKRFVNQTPSFYQVADNDVRFCGVLLKIEKNTGKTLHIQRIFY